MPELDQAGLVAIVGEILEEVTGDLHKVSHSVQCIGVSASAGSESTRQVELTDPKLPRRDKPTFDALARKLARGPAGRSQSPRTVEIDLRQQPASPSGDLPASARYFYAHEEHLTWPGRDDLPAVRLMAWVFTSQRPTTSFSPLVLRATMDRLAGTVRVRHSAPSREAAALAIRCGALRDGLEVLANVHRLDGIALWQYDEYQRRFRPVVTSGVGDTPLSVPSVGPRSDARGRRGIISQVLPDRSPVIYDAEDPGLWQPQGDGPWEPFDTALFKARGWRSCVALPIVCSGRLVGALSAYSRRSATALHDAADALMEDAALCSDAILVRREHDVLAALTARYEDELLTSNVSLSALSLSHDVLHYYRTVLEAVEHSRAFLEAGQTADAKATLAKAQETMGRTKPAIAAMRKLASEARIPESSKGPQVTPDPREVLGELTDLLRSILPHFSKGKRLDREDIEVTVGGRPRPVCVPAMTLERVVVNLCVNSAQWSAAHVWVTAHFDRSDEEVEIVVRDDGHGIPRGARERVFDRFYSGRDGSGLGLYVVRALVRRAGGEVYLQSYHRSEGAEHGTAITVVLPTEEP